VIGTLEGWADKYGAANIGFGIVVAIVLVAAMAGGILFGINLK
jgi:hypothetical protein